VCGFGNNTR